MQGELFDRSQNETIKLKEGAFLFKAFALQHDKTLLSTIDTIAQTSPFRQMMTPWGRKMSVAMTNCGKGGWISEKQGYRYSALDTLTKKAWPVMPDCFLSLAKDAAQAAGFLDFLPNACLINKYAIGSRMGLHQDKDEGDFSQPIVSVSLGLPAKFLFGGLTRSEKPLRVMLHHGDVFVFGGPARLAYHGIDPLKEGRHELTHVFRYNLTFRSVQTIEKET